MTCPWCGGNLLWEWDDDLQRDVRVCLLCARRYDEKAPLLLLPYAKARRRTPKIEVEDDE